MTDWKKYPDEIPSSIGYYIVSDSSTVREGYWKQDHWSGIPFDVTHWKPFPMSPSQL